MKRLILATLVLALIAPLTAAQFSTVPDLRVILEDGAPFDWLAKPKSDRDFFNTMRAGDWCGNDPPTPPPCIPQQNECQEACDSYCAIGGLFNACSCDPGYEGERIGSFCETFECTGPWWAFCA